MSLLFCLCDSFLCLLLLSGSLSCVLNSVLQVIVIGVAQL